MDSMSFWWIGSCFRGMLFTLLAAFIVFPIVQNFLWITSESKFYPKRNHYAAGITLLIGFIYTLVNCYSIYDYDNTNKPKRKPTPEEIGGFYTLGQASINHLAHDGIEIPLDYLFVIHEDGSFQAKNVPGLIRYDQAIEIKLWSGSGTWVIEEGSYGNWRINLYLNTFNDKPDFHVTRLDIFGKEAPYSLSRSESETFFWDYEFQQ